MRNRISGFGFTPEEANKLAELYATLLEKEYGSARAAPIIRRLESAGTLTRGEITGAGGNGLGSSQTSKPADDGQNTEPSLRSKAKCGPLINFLEAEVHRGLEI
jgi:hypothetical protein